MFIYGNFCHVASNDRWQNQSSIFLYKTIDTLQQMTTAGYFNRAKLDLHIGDIIFATVETIQETTTYDTYVFRVLTVNEPITVEQISLGNGGGGTGSISSVNGVQPVDGNVEITGDNITATVGEEEATITQHLTTLKNDEAELGEQVQSLQQSINGKQDALTAEQLAAANSGITAAKVASYDAYAGEISAAKTTADKADNAAEVAQQTANLAGQEAAQALSGLAGKVNIAQGAENAGKVMTVGADGNVVPTAGYATESWVNQQIQTQIGTIETALAEV